MAHDSTFSDDSEFPQTTGHMVVADPLAAFERKSMVKLIAPAKVNLFLGIGAQRDDGYHHATTVMHALSLHDVLLMDRFPCEPQALHGEQADGKGVQVCTTCYTREGISSLEIDSEQNIATKAVKRLAAKLGRTVRERITISIEKHIPFEGGLGGGSSNAAAALLGAAKLWGLADDAPELVEVAQELGADVRFFLHGGCACLTGVGNVFHHALTPMKTPLVLVKPEGGVSTSAAYRTFDDLVKDVSVADLERFNALSQTASAALHACDVPLYNNLAPASEKIMPELCAVREWLGCQHGVRDVLLCGSGSSSFGVCESFDDALRITAEAKKHGWWARSTAFSSARAAVMPAH